ncbi:MAG: hypothetical protein GVY28_05985, partial [Alphaproteobacteria bacterium]|nr:hypothetical protein [Alphaproteobacteria bacterium]
MSDIADRDGPAGAGPQDGPGNGAEVLGRVEAKRGYDLPYHRMLASHDPGLLDAYDRFYTALTLAPRVLTTAERELVWAALLV